MSAPGAAPAANPNLAARLAEVAARHADRAALVEYAGGGVRRISFGELAAQVEALGGGFRAAGVGPGGRVLLFVPMCADLYALLLGCLHAGGTAVFVDAWADRRRLDAAVAAARPQLFVGSPGAQLLRLLSPAVRGIPRHWWVGRRWLRAGRYARADLAGTAMRVDADAPALVTFTTGSTGRPKAAARSHAFLWAQHQALAAHLQPRPDDVDLPTLPVFVLNNLALGVTSVLPDFDPRFPARIDPARIHRQLVAEGVTTSSGSPAFYARLAEWCAATGCRLPLRALWTGGAPVYPPLARLLAERVEGRAHVVYGSTEAEPIAGIEAGALVRASEQQPAGGVCVGRPAWGVALRLVRPHDDALELGEGGWAEWEVGAGEVGEVVVAGEHVLGEYLDAPEETRRHKIGDGARVWHRTGDAARLDDEGRLWLMGRVGGRVRRAGRVWWSTPPEAAALRVPGVTHAAYLGLPDAALGERAVLCVETVSGAAAPTLESVRAAVCPSPVDELRLLRRIPRDPRHASKTDYAALRRQLG